MLITKISLAVVELNNLADSNGCATLCCIRSPTIYARPRPRLTCSIVRCSCLRYEIYVPRHVAPKDIISYFFVHICIFISTQPLRRIVNGLISYFIESESALELDDSARTHQ